MKAARLVGPKHFEMVEAEVPVPEEGQCLIKLEKLSVCGSDIRHEYSHLFPEEHYPVRLGAPCHECAGVIVESKSQEFREGQRVIIYPGRENPTGGLVEYITAGPRWMCALPDEGELSEWLMCQPSATVLYSCQQMGTLLGKDVVILGQGAIGLSFSMITSRLGAHQVIGIDPLGYRLEWGKKVGATHTLNPNRVEVTDAVQELTGGRGPDVVVDAAGYPDTLNMAFRLVRQFGTVMVFGVQGDPRVPIQHELLMDKQPTIIPTTGGRIPEPMAPIRTMVDLKHRGWADPGQLVTHTLPVEEVQRAFDMYEGQLDNVIKVVMTV
ncbi:MAG: zinc-binding dehydrogenase [Dehalococcoidia bacterium]